MATQIESFLALFVDGNVEDAADALTRIPQLLNQESGITKGEACLLPLASDDVNQEAHWLLRQCVTRNNGHCYKPAHLAIADLLTPPHVKAFRAAVIDGSTDAVTKHLRSHPGIIHAEFTAGRGIAQAVHHWKSLSLGSLLLEANANAEALTTLGESPLTMQLRFGTIEGVRLLLEHGANPNHGAGGHMPSSSMEELIELMLAYGWNVDRGQLLHDAKHGYGKRVRIWLKYGADPNQSNEMDQTALHLFAALGKGGEALRDLVECGAHIGARDKNGKTALDLARESSNSRVRKQLEILGAVE